MSRMSERNYDLWTKACLAGAVVSAMVFDKAGSWNWLVGAFGIVSAIVGVAVYFYNSRDDEPAEEEHSRTSAMVAHMETLQPKFYGGEAPDPRSEMRQLAFWAADVPQPDEAQGIRFSVQVHDTLNTRFYSGMKWALKFQEFEEAHSRAFRDENNFVAEVVEIVERLSPTCEFELSAQGGLIIRPRLVQRSASPEHLWLDNSFDKWLNSIEKSRPGDKIH
jgi:hypothetical protein